MASCASRRLNTTQRREGGVAMREKKNAVSASETFVCSSLTSYRKLNGSFMSRISEERAVHALPSVERRECFISHLMSLRNTRAAVFDFPKKI